VSFSWKERQSAIEGAANNSVDVMIVGGGAVGCSVAAHLSAIGISCAVIEKEDLAYGASGNSTGLAHAGLRYLAQGRFLYVFHESRERDRLQKLAPQWVRPFDFLFPVYKGDPFSLVFVRLGTTIYDAMAWLDATLTGEPTPRPHAVLSAEEMAQRIPGLQREGLEGATEYFVDAQLQDSRFTLGFAQYAAEHGATIITHASVDKVEKTNKGISVHCTDRLGGASFEMKGRMLLNATGAWIDALQTGQAGSRHVQPSQGIHLVIDRIADRPLIFSTAITGRVFFVLPYGRDASLVGTTDTPLQAPADQAKPSKAEVQELMAYLFKFFPKLKSPDFENRSIRDVYWGIRPLVYHSGSSVQASREHALIKDSQFLWSIPGVKLTAARAVGEEVALELAHALGNAARQEILLGRLPGGENINNYQQFVKESVEIIKAQYFSDDVASYLVRVYGARWGNIVRVCQSVPALQDRVLADEPWIYAEVVYALQEEMVMTLNDLLWRRTKWAHYRDLPAAALERITQILGQFLGLDGARRQAEILSYQAEHARHRWPNLSV
jgi:glycerol-3-phosphate dehydrogenase